jgi:hypothetical protein
LKKCPGYGKKKATFLKIKYRKIKNTNNNLINIGNDWKVTLIWRKAYMPQSRWKIIVVFLLSLTDLYLSSGINGFSLTPLKLIRYAEDTYSQSGLNYYGHKLNLPDGPHTAVFIHAITEYIVKDLHVDLPKRGLLVLEDILNELRDSGLMAAADRVYITLLGLVLFEEWYEEATALIARYRGSGDDDKVVLLIDDLDIPEGQVGYVYWGTLPS